MKRKIIKIDENKCNGCGDCIPECKEGALQIIEGKCRLVSELFCDGLGACIGHCPEGAITIEEREAEPYDERKVIDYLLDKPVSVMKAHLQHLVDHDAMKYYSDAIAYLKEKDIENPLNIEKKENTYSGCPGSKQIELNVLDGNGKDDFVESEDEMIPSRSELRQWPVQLHLVSPDAPYFNGRELVLMSTCGPVASATVHRDYLKDRSVVVACPKLDYTEPYADKLASIFANSDMPKAIVVRMEVPCCGGLTMLTAQAAERSGRDDLTVVEHVMDIKGRIRKETVIFEPEKELA